MTLYIGVDLNPYQQFWDFRVEFCGIGELRIAEKGRAESVCEIRSHQPIKKGRQTGGLLVRV
jgi:hypothetical protein